jgi:hypothetical protein
MRPVSALIRQKLSPDVKVFWFFFSKKTNLLLSYEKEAKRLLFLALHLQTCKLDGRSLAEKMYCFNTLPGRAWVSKRNSFSRKWPRQRCPTYEISVRVRAGAKRKRELAKMSKPAERRIGRRQIVPPIRAMVETGQHMAGADKGQAWQSRQAKTAL